MPRLADRALMTTATTGTGTVTLGAAVAGYQTFAAAGVLNGEQVRYVIEEGNAWEIGLGTYTASGTTLSRGPTASSASGAAITLSGNARVGVDAAAADIAQPSDLLFPFAIFGDGSDGDVTISGAVTLTRDMFYNNLTLAAGAALNTGNFKVFVRNTLDLSAAPAGAIIANGGNGGPGATAGTAGTAGTRITTGTTLSASNSQAGGAGGTTTGVAAANAGASTASIIGGVPAGGAGGLGSSGAGGAGSTAATTTSLNASVRRLVLDFVHNFQGALGAYFMTRNAAGGGGGGDGTAGGGGGGGGGQGGCVAIWARVIARGANTTAGIIRAMGGNGGNGGSAIAGNRGGGGGGSGGPGGFVYIACGLLTGSAIVNAIDVSGGAGGNGGNGFGTGVGGAGGGRGGRGRVVKIDVFAGTGTQDAPDNGAVGGAASGVTGGTGAAAVVSQVTL